MHKKLTLLITDKEVILYNGLSQGGSALTWGIEHVPLELKNLISLDPKASLRLLIDRNHQDVHEEQLPPLMFWDRLRLLAYKKEEWISQGKFYGYHFFKQEGQSYLQWVNISQNDFLIPWLSWIKSLPNPFEGVFFAFVEGGQFLKKNFPSSRSYHLLLYEINHRMRYVIFKNKRFLLYRPFSGEEDLRTSLHFLSRLYPDIHENLQVLSLIKDVSLSFPQMKPLPDPHDFVNFLITQKGSPLSLHIMSSSQNPWIRRGAELIFVCLIIVSGFNIFQITFYKKEKYNALSEINKLKIKIQNKKEFLINKDIMFLRSALNHYRHIHSQIRSPFETLEKLALLIEKHGLRLQRLIWQHNQVTSVEISFLMKNYQQDALSEQFTNFLTSLRKTFPLSEIQVIEAPLRSGSHETYDYPPVLSPPRVHLRIVGL